VPLLPTIAIRGILYVKLDVHIDRPTKLYQLIASPCIVRYILYIEIDVIIHANVHKIYKLRCRAAARAIHIYPDILLILDILMLCLLLCLALLLSGGLIP